MASGVKISNYAEGHSQKSRQIQALQKHMNQVEMAESEGIQETVNQAVVLAATAVMLVLRDADA